MSAGAVEAYRAGLKPGVLATVDALRSIVAAAHPGLVERIKWNAPSFALGDEDRITLGVAPKGGVRVVLHRGVKAKDSSAFRFEDKDRLARWPTADRGVLTFADAGEVEARRKAIATLFARWLEATS